jgi:glycopeptide antibiotics resistance protein
MIGERVLCKSVLIGGVVVYLLFLLCILFVQVGTNNRSTYYKTAQSNFIPFQTTYKSVKLGLNNHYGLGNTTNHYYLYLALRNIIGNILLFIPLGLIAPFLFSKLRTTRWIVLFGLTFSFCIETFQLILKIGVSDVDDLLYNTLGAILGFWIYCKLQFQLFEH